MSEEMQSAWPDHFRYVDSIGPEGVTIECQRYMVLRESEHCYWIVHFRWICLARMDLAKGRLSPHAKRVLKSSCRRFAYPEKSKALESYKVRKRRQLGHAELAMERARAALQDVESLEAINDKHLCSGGDYIKELNWDC